jgi:hypothetical protein
MKNLLFDQCLIFFYKQTIVTITQSYGIYFLGMKCTFLRGLAFGWIFLNTERKSIFSRSITSPGSETCIHNLKKVFKLSADCIC